MLQDNLVIVFFWLMPALYGREQGLVPGQIGMALLKGGLFLAVAWLLGLCGLFTLTVIGLCAGVAFAGGALNLWLILGAFAAGLVDSESIHRHRILSDIPPFKGLIPVRTANPRRTRKRRSDGVGRAFILRPDGHGPGGGGGRHDGNG